MYGSLIRKGQALGGTKTEARSGRARSGNPEQHSLTPILRAFPRAKTSGKKPGCYLSNPSAGMAAASRGVFASGTRCTVQFKWTHDGFHVEVPLAPATFRVYRRQAGMPGLLREA